MKPRVHPRKYEIRETETALAALAWCKARDALDADALGMVVSEIVWRPVTRTGRAIVAVVVGGK